MAGLDADRKSVGVHDDIYARCLILSQDDETVAFVALDLLGFSNEKVNDIVQIVGTIKGNFVNDYVIASTHCHSAPDVIGAWGPTIRGIPYRSGVDRDYLAQLYGGIVESIYLAAKNLRPAKLKFGSAMIPESSRVSKNIRDKNIIDREVTAVQAVGVDGKIIATLVNYACHPEVLWSDNHLITADFPGYLCRYIERKVGGVALFFNSALGGMVTADVGKSADSKSLHTFEEARRIGQTIAEHALGALDKQPFSKPASFSFIRREVYVPVGGFKFHLARLLGIVHRRTYSGKLRTEVSFMDIGDAQMVMVPGELFPNLGLMLKEKMSKPYKFVVGLANDEIGYLMSGEDFGRKKYRYESSMSPGREAGDIVIEMLMGILGGKEEL